MSGGGGVAGADNADGAGPVEVFAAGHGDQRRGGGNVIEQVGIIGLAGGDQFRAVALKPGQFILGLHLGGDARGGAAPLEQAGQGLDPGFGRAETVEQLAEGDRADIFGADQAKPGNALDARQDQARRDGAHALGAFFSEPILGSVSLSRRTILARCW